MKTVLFRLGSLNISIEILLSIGIVLLLARGTFFWIKNKIGRGFVLFLIISAWWNSLIIDESSKAGLNLQNVDTVPILKIGDFIIGGTIFYSWLVMAVLTLLSYLATRNLKTTLHVSHLQTAMEFIVHTIRSQIIEVSGDNPARYLPIMGTFFLFIGMSNLMTIIPWFQAPTASLSTTAAFSLCVLIAMPIFGIRNAGVKGYLKKYVEPTPIMLPFNVLSDFSSTFALAFRLYGNMLSGAVLASILMVIIPFIIPFFMQILGLVTGMIQAYIFALLAIVYVSSVSPKHPFEDRLDFY